MGSDREKLRESLIKTRRKKGIETDMDWEKRGRRERKECKSEIKGVREEAGS